MCEAFFKVSFSLLCSLCILSVSTFCICLSHVKGFPQISGDSWLPIQLRTKPECRESIDDPQSSRGIYMEVLIGVTQSLYRRTSDFSLGVHKPCFQNVVSRVNRGGEHSVAEYTDITFFTFL